MSHDLHKLLNWKLREGSHEFPGSDGGTCINEVAIVVAGFPYRKVGGLGDMPECFSRPLSAYALRLNDVMPDELRQELLLPFVVRLAGTADTREIECERADLIVIRTVSAILPIVLRLRGLEDLARYCESARTRQEAYAAAERVRDHLHAAYVAANAAYAAYAAATAAAAAAATAATAATAAAAAADAAYAAAAVQCQVWGAATSILDAALKIGRQAEPIEASIIVSRAERAKHLVHG